MTLHRFRKIVRDAAICCASVLLTLGVMEIGFRVYTPSDGIAVSLAGQAWFKKYWKPINRLGFRDIAYTRAEVMQHKNIVVLGDSFTAGHGIENIHDRFPDLLRARLGPEWMLEVVAHTGWGTMQELSAIRSFPIKPDILVLQYYVNDIEPVLRVAHRYLPEPQMPTGIAAHSYLANYFYWRSRGMVDSSYIELMKYCERGYQSPKRMAEHEQELEGIISYAAKNRILLLPVLFPHLADVKGTAWITKKIGNVFAQHGIEPIDLAPVLADRPASELIVNAHDPHPNKILHAEVADLIQKRIDANCVQASGWCVAP